MARVYPVPVTVMSTLKVVIPVMPGETVRVKVALIELPGFSLWPSRFQVMVMGPFALWGFQFVVVRFSVNRTLHSFLT